MEDGVIKGYRPGIEMGHGVDDTIITPAQLHEVLAAARAKDPLIDTFAIQTARVVQVGPPLKALRNAGW